MKILVTGGAGFIGSHIVDAYLEEGHQVVVVDNLSTGRESNINQKATFHRADIRDADLMNKVFREENVDVLCHQAAQIDVRRSVADPAYDASVNILGFLTLMECCVRDGVSNVIFASSGGAIYGEQDYFPADESHPTRPISPYGIAKHVTEQYLFYYYTIHGINAVNLRFGPRQNPEGEAGVVAVFTSKMLRGDQAVINGDGKQTRDYVFVGDVVQANTLALDQKGIAISSGSACHAGLPEPSGALTAMGLSPEAVASSLRLSLGPTNTEAEVQGFLEALPVVVARVRGVY